MKNTECRMQNAELINPKIRNPQSAIRNSEGGFTLIELIIATTIVSMILAIILSGMRLSIRAWEVGEDRVEVYQTGRVILEKMSQDIKSMYPYRYEKEITTEDKLMVSEANPSEKAKKMILALKCEPHGLRFTTIAESVNPVFQGRGLREVFYYIEKDPDEKRDRLLYRENIIFPHHTFEETSLSSSADESDKPMVSEANPKEGGYYKNASVVTVSDQIAELKFKYYLVRREKIEDGKEEDVGEWVESFSGYDELREEEEAKAVENEQGNGKKKRGKPVLRAIEIKLSMYEMNPDDTLNMEKIISFQPLVVPINIGREIKAT
ncbi:MAG: type II secretion system protein [Nitrospinae bacterium]|nr:type II secretion system protein [Nitrospinota bacterium]